MEQKERWAADISEAVRDTLLDSTAQMNNADTNDISNLLAYADEKEPETLKLDVTRSLDIGELLAFGEKSAEDISIDGKKSNGNYITTTSSNNPLNRRGDSHRSLDSVFDPRMAEGVTRSDMLEENEAQPLSASTKLFTRSTLNLSGVLPLKVRMRAVSHK